MLCSVLVIKGNHLEPHFAQEAELTDEFDFAMRIRHFLQYECPHGRVNGSTNTPLHEGQLQGQFQICPGDTLKST